MLMPKRVKWRKQMRGRMRGKALRGAEVSFGEFGLQALEQQLKKTKGKKPSRGEVSAAVRQLKDFKGVTGSISFDSKGDPVKAKYFVLQFAKQAYPGKVVKVIEQQAPSAKTP